MALQIDERILISGDFTRLRPNGAATDTVRNKIARLHADGSLDTAFDPNAEPFGVRCVAVQPDGKILLGGDFRTLRPNGVAIATTRNSLARVLADGSLDVGFDPNVTGSVYSVLVQPDGAILLAGWLTRLQPNGAISPTIRNRIARVHSDGSLDQSFDPNANDPVYGLALQTDGRIILGGRFTSLQPNGVTTPAARKYAARINADGSLDPDFDPKADMPVYNAGIQPDGRILLGGEFNNFRPNGATTITSRQRFARLSNSAANQNLSATDAGHILWRRGGTSPDVSQVTFDQSSDGGATWTPLGGGSRVSTSGDWELTGLTLPGSVQLRARGRIIAGYHTGSSGIIETVSSFPSPMQTWNQTWFGSISGTGVAAPDADPNGNGIPNLLEYALGGVPIGQTSNTAVLPQVSLNAATGRVELAFTRYPGRSDITLIIQAANDPAGPWEEVAHSVGGASFVITATGYEVTESSVGMASTVYFAGKPAEGTLRFLMRVKATVP